MSKRDWSSDAVAGALMLIVVGLFVTAGIVGFFVGRHTKSSSSTTTASSPTRR